MGKKSLLKKAAVVAIITVFFTTSILPAISGINIETNEKQNIKTQKPEEVKKKVTVTCYNFGMPGELSKEIEISQHEVEYLYEKIKELNFEVAYNPSSAKTQQLQDEIVDLADEFDLLPNELSKNQVKEHYLQVYKQQTNRKGFLPQTQGKASEFLCTFVSYGSGVGLPIIALPRLIPILMIPIPRLFMRWKAQEAVTSCGGLRSGTGFIAYGQQNGIALGFWGLGFTFSLPPLMGVYGLAGYSLYATVDAEYIDFYPPNSPPVISLIDPSDGEINVPLSLSELRFQISDLNGDLMSYTVTTSPDIGSSSGNLKPDGLYSVPISGLEDLTEYSWHVEVTDGMDTTSDDYFFTTEAVAPIVSNPSPQDGERYVPLSLSDLSFHLKDFQGDPMDYTVETVPDIGSGSGSGVGEGTYSVPIYDLDYTTGYTWYVNVTDGEHQTNKIFYFQTEPVMEFDPFDEGWQYRKEITIDHTRVDGDLENFPILISMTDVDLRDKAQDDGDDILFMDGTGLANRLYHEIEQYESSSGKLVSWVNVTSLSSTTDTVIWLYYGNPGCSSQQHPIVVWDSDYLFVSHMDGSGTIISDSTSNGNDGTKDGANDPEEVNGKIGKCQDFEKDNSEHIVLNNMIAGLSAMTVEAWEKTETKTSSVHVMSTMYGSDGTGDIAWRHQTNSDTSGFGFDAWKATSGFIGSVWSGSGADIVLGTWQYYTGVWTGSSMYVYVDSTLEGTTNSTSGTMASHANMKTAIGATDIGYGNYHDGLLDEIRISGIARSPEWISTEYNNQNDPSSFIEIGPEVPAP